MPRAPVRIAVVQMAMSEDKADNVARALDGVRRAARAEANIVCLPELFATRYFCQSEDADHFSLAEAIPGPTTEAIARAAGETRTSVVAGVFERRAAGVYHNSVAVFGPDGRQRSLYRKMHIPDDPQFYEKFYFAPGDLGFITCDLPAASIGPLICWDQWFPEAARLTALKGAELLCYPTAIGWLPAERAALGDAQLTAWQTVQRAHAISNGVFVAAVNRVGHEPSSEGGIEFWGHSFVCDPMGQVIAEAGDGEELLLADCDLSKIEATRQAWPFLRDRRIDAYRALVQRYDD